MLDGVSFLMFGFNATTNYINMHTIGSGGHLSSLVSRFDNDEVGDQTLISHELEGNAAQEQHVQELCGEKESRYYRNDFAASGIELGKHFRDEISQAKRATDSENNFPHLNKM